jgi:ring-1,2-phenylacetyl-CoA epoxidase subunit PaaE
MNNGFYTLKISEVIRETDLAVTLKFNLNAEMKDIFAYKAGQYLTLLANIQGEEVRRAYSLCTSPTTDNYIAVTVKAVENGKMSNYVNKEVKTGDEIQVMPPNGKFFIEADAAKQRTIILFGGGSGITPLMGIAKTILHSEPLSNIYLVYANRSVEDVIFKKELENMEQENKNRFKIFYSYDKAPMMWFGLKGFLTEKTVGEILKHKIGIQSGSAEYFICGPSPMMEVVKNGLKTYGIPENKVHTEYFAAPTSSNNSEALEGSPSAFAGESHIKVTLYGKTSEIHTKKNELILDAANRAGLQPPYSCTVGVCTTCRAKVLKGEVKMLEREGLSDAEIAEGYVLTCQSVPMSADIELIFE